MASLGNKYGHSEDFYDIDELSGVSSAYTTLSYHYIFEKLYHTDFSKLGKYAVGMAALVAIGEKMGMTHEDMEKAYFDKNQVNYDRLASGY